MKIRAYVGLLSVLFAAGCLSFEGDRREEAEAQLVKTPAPIGRPVTADDITPDNAHELYQRLLDEMDRQ
ncbi:MAG: hypothetical protein L0Y72_08940 [Gemmataceae bacterium]|nr:hypothetical protein [Gemmataceae bacterium]MCI0739156.1 hypothetical protein [Gemmataceae bacterium]